MNDQRVKTDNEVIADFIGRRLWSKDDLKDGRMQQWELPMCSGYYPATLLFHEKWDWLMPACQKWDNLFKSDPLLKERLTDTYSEYLRLCQLLQNSVTQFEIDPVFEQLVKNIHWYQKQKSS